MATLDGNAVEGSGVMRGGFVARKASLGFKENDSLEELEQRVQATEKRSVTVELGKQSETSWTRKVLLLFFTY